jgi:hypothetical protein
MNVYQWPVSLSDEMEIRQHERRQCAEFVLRIAKEIEADNKDASPISIEFALRCLDHVASRIVSV